MSWIFTLVTQNTHLRWLVIILYHIKQSTSLCTPGDVRQADQLCLPRSDSQPSWSACVLILAILICVRTEAQALSHRFLTANHTLLLFPSPAASAASWGFAYGAWGLTIKRRWHLCPAQRASIQTLGMGLQSSPSRQVSRLPLLTPRAHGSHLITDTLENLIPRSGHPSQIKLTVH